MKMSTKKWNQAWADWETKMESANFLLDSASDLGSTISINGQTRSLSIEKIQLVIDQLEEAKALVKNLEFIDDFVLAENGESQHG